MVMIVPLTLKHLEQFGNRQYESAVRGYAVVDDDERVLGIAGILHSMPVQAFSSMSPELKKKPKVIVKMAHKIRDLLKSYDVDVYAVADNSYNNSARFLMFVGFEFCNMVDDLRVFKWPIQ